MAITKLLRIKENRRGRNPGTGLHRCLRYICNPEKTDNGIWIGGNCGGIPDLAYGFMTDNKHRWKQEHGSQGFHYVISFSPGEQVPPRLALKIADEFCQKLIPEHLYVTAAHMDTDHMHVHICFDSVNTATGTIFHSGKHDWIARIQPITDTLCQKYGLQTLSYDPDKERASMYHAEWESGKNTDVIKKEVTWADLIRDDIDEALSRAASWESFLHILQQMHYTVRDGKYLSLRPAGKEKPMRSVRLGQEYSREALYRKISETKIRTSPSASGQYKHYGNAALILRSMHIYLDGSRPRGFSPLQRNYYRRWMALSHVRKPDFQNSWKYRKQVVALGKLTDDLCYIFDHDLTDLQSVAYRLNALKKHSGPDAARERSCCTRILSEYADTALFSSVLKEDGVYVAPDFTGNRIYKITVNETLFQNINFDTETMTVRIPGRQEYLELYAADSRSYNCGKMISSYLYADADYRVLSQDGKLICILTGTQAAEHFKYKEILQPRKSSRKENTHGRS